MKSILRHVWRIIAIALLLLGIYWAPKDVQDWQIAAEPWKRVVGMLDQNTLLWIFALSLSVWVAWKDIRPLARSAAGRLFRSQNAAALGRTQRSEWDQEWHELRFRRDDFWNSAIRAYDYWNEGRGRPPLRTLISEATFPSELPLPSDKRFSDWVWEFGKALNESSAALNSFATEVYPAVTPARSASSLTFLGGEIEFVKFDDYRRDLSKFWDHWGRQEPLEQVIREQRADGLVRRHCTEIIFLTYLEIARERWTQEGGGGKTGLFRLGRRNTETVD